MANPIDVARALRAPIEKIDPEILIPAFATLQLSDLSPSAALAFIFGALDHQVKVADKDSKVFPARVVEVKRVKRESNGKTLGQKAVIMLETTDSDGKAQDEEITTHWVEFLGESDPATVRDPRIAWELALSQSIEEDALAWEGRSVFVRKAFLPEQKTAKGGPPRFIADIQVDHRENSGGSDRGGRSSKAEGKGRSSRSGGGDVDVRAAADALDIVWGNEFKVLADVDWTEKDDTKVAEAAADALKVSDDDFDAFIDDFDKAKGSTLDRVLIAADKWLG